MFIDVLKITRQMRAFAEAGADERYRLNRELRSPDDKKYGEIAAIEQLGTLAETAFAKWLGIWPSTPEGLRPDGGVDYVIRGWTVDVKGTSRERGDLLEFRDKRHTADIYVLVVVDVHSCRLAGWAYGVDLLAAPVISTGHNHSHCLKQSQLRLMTELRQVLLKGKPS